MGMSGQDGVVAALCLSRPLPPVWQCAAVSVAAGLDRGEYSMLCFGWRGLRSGRGNGNWGGAGAAGDAVAGATFDAARFENLWRGIRRIRAGGPRLEIVQEGVMTGK